MKTYALLLIFILSLNATIKAQETLKTTLRVLTFNILHGANTTGDFDLDKIAQVIKKANPDLVALQEVDFKTNRAKQMDLTTELALRTKMTSLFARAMPYDGGEYGEGVLSRFSFLSTKNIPLPYTPDNEPKAAAEIKFISNAGDTIIFIGTHLDHLDAGLDRVQQAKKLNAVFTEDQVPKILAGDLNDVPGSKTINILESKWGSSYQFTRLEATFPSKRPDLKLDYVMFYPKNRWKVIKTEVFQDSIASDHCAFLSILELK